MGNDASLLVVPCARYVGDIGDTVDSFVKWFAFFMTYNNACHDGQYFAAIFSWIFYF